MPELPEVETTIRYLKPKIIGRKIKAVWSDWPKISRDLSFPELEKKLLNKKFTGIARRGKNILLELNSQEVLWIHLKMTGHLLLRPLDIPEKSPFQEKVNKYIHFQLILDNNMDLALSDLRKFGRVRYIPEPITDKLLANSFKDLGFEPLEKEFTRNVLKDLLFDKRNQNKQLKIFLMDQGIIAGIGNIYASEILFEAKLNPKRKVGSLKENEITDLFNAIKQVLQKAVDTRGTSISDFRDPEGKPGGYGNIRRVYQRKGEPCPEKCGGIVESFKQGQRTTFWCPRCQK